MLSHVLFLLHHDTVECFYRLSVLADVGQGVDRYSEQVNRCRRVIKLPDMRPEKHHDLCVLHGF